MIKAPARIETKVALVFGLACATLLALCWAFYQANQEAAKSHERVATTDEVLLTLGNLQVKITEAETSQRGYILTGQPEFLEPYRGAVEGLEQERTLLKKLTKGNPAQEQLTGRLDRLIEQRLDRIQKGIQLRQTEGFQQALEVIRTGKGGELMDQIREVLRNIAQEEQMVLNRRFEKNKSVTTKTLAFFAVVAVADVGLLFVIYYGVRRDLAQKRRINQEQGKLLKELEAANQELKDFAHVVSHDLKAPLRGIATLAAFLQADLGDQLDASARAQLELLSGRVRRMHDMIEGMLDYTRLGRTTEKRRAINVGELVRGILDALSPPAHIQIVISPGLPTVYCEPMRLQQIFQNLLSNAIKYIDKPAGRIEIGATEAPQAWTFSILDNGPGIEKKYHAKIFQLFQTLNPKDEHESTGIGLAVVKRAAELLGGKVWIESEPGRGSTFFFNLPKNGT